jgi:hypothetical protein
VRDVDCVSRRHRAHGPWHAAAMRRVRAPRR